VAPSHVHDKVMLQSSHFASLLDVLDNKPSARRRLRVRTVTLHAKLLPLPLC
jgi:hypothetical protein